MWGCVPHWFVLPKALRDELWASYRPGQEVGKRPTPEYMAAARAIQDWIRAAGPAAVPLHLVTGKEGWPAYVAPPIDPHLALALHVSGYTSLRLHRGRVCGLHRFMYTVGIVVGLDFETYSHRYCYADFAEARGALGEWSEDDEHPPGPWIKRKGLEPELSGPGAMDCCA